MKGDLPTGLLRILPGHLNHPSFLPFWNGIPELNPSLMPASQATIARLLIPLVPLIKRAAADIDLSESLSHTEF
jgi:hypothetical protein